MSSTPANDGGGNQNRQPNRAGQKRKGGPSHNEGAKRTREALVRLPFEPDGSLHLLSYRDVTYKYMGDDQDILLSKEDPNQINFRTTPFRKKDAFSQMGFVENSREGTQAIARSLELTGKDSQATGIAYFAVSYSEQDISKARRIAKAVEKTIRSFDKRTEGTSAAGPRFPEGTFAAAPRPREGLSTVKPEFSKGPFTVKSEFPEGLFAVKPEFPEGTSTARSPVDTQPPAGTVTAPAAMPTSTKTKSRPSRWNENMGNTGSGSASSANPATPAARTPATSAPPNEDDEIADLENLAWRTTDRCVRCHKLDHRLSHCPYPDRQNQTTAMVGGCPVCNVTDHVFDTYPEVLDRLTAVGAGGDHFDILPKDFLFFYKYLVENRVNRCPIHSRFMCWLSVVIAAVERPDIDITGCPWTLEWSSQYNTTYHAKGDAAKNSALLRGRLHYTDWDQSKHTERDLPIDQWCMGLKENLQPQDLVGLVESNQLGHQVSPDAEKNV